VRSDDEKPAVDAYAMWRTVTIGRSETEELTGRFGATARGDVECISRRRFWGARQLAPSELCWLSCLAKVLLPPRAFTFAAVRPARFRS